MLFDFAFNYRAKHLGILINTAPEKTVNREIYIARKAGRQVACRRDLEAAMQLSFLDSIRRLWRRKLFSYMIERHLIRASHSRRNTGESRLQNGCKRRLAGRGRRMC